MPGSETPFKVVKGRPTPRDPVSNYHRMRKAIHLACFLVFLILPFVNVVRFDLPRQRFYFAGFELWINEFSIIFFALMFLMFVIVASSVVYGRVYCGYMCPQMIFSEAAAAAEDWLKRKINKKFPGLKPKQKVLVWRASAYLVIGAASVFLSFIFISYFVEPRDLLGRLLSLDIHTAAGICGASVTLFTFLDFAFVRTTFCTTVCPYGYLQGFLADKHTLLVQYRDEKHQCIECLKCLRVCHMGIDIRKSPFQIECVHCAECIDACDGIMAKLGKPNLIHYAWGESGAEVHQETRWYRKLGFSDAKRVVVLLVILFYASGLLVVLAMRKNVLVQLAPDRSSLYRLDADGTVYNKFRLKLGNRSHNPELLSLTLEGLPGARLTLPANPIPLKPGEESSVEFEIAARPFPGSQDVNHFRITAKAAAARESETFEETFILPVERKTP
jgi:cytochrome c oxidase accessory protein FixG